MTTATVSRAPGTATTPKDQYRDVCARERVTTPRS
jgi:hypothetical protein